MLPQAGRSTSSDHAPARGRHGFTLLEVSLVLAMILVVAALAVPIYHATLRSERLRAAAETIRTDWTRTRSQAMKTGETQVWVCVLASSRFSASPYGSQFGVDGMSTADASDLASSTTGLSPTQTPTDVDSFGRGFPEGVTISEVLMSEADSVAMMTQASHADDGGVATLFFYPDGSSSSGRITVSNEDGRSIAVSINGLAGTIRVLPVEETSL